MRRIYLLVLIASIGSSSAFAQVAAPSLLPGSAGLSDPLFLRTPTFIPVNPAVMPWRGYSTGGGGIARAELSTLKTTDDPTVSVPFEDSYGGFQWTGTQLAFGLQSFLMTGSSEGGNFQEEGTDFAVAGSFGGWLSLGASYNTDKDKRDEQTTESTGNKVGVSARFANLWYVGFAGGQQHVAQEYQNHSEDNWGGDRATTAYGVGFLNDGPWRLHAEYWNLQAGKVGNKDIQIIKSDNTQSMVIETARQPWVVGLTVMSRVQTAESASEEFKWTSAGNEFTVGLVPEKGLSVLFHYGWTDTKFEFTKSSVPFKYVGTSRALSAVWIF